MELDGDFLLYLSLAQSWIRAGVLSGQERCQVTCSKVLTPNLLAHVPLSRVLGQLQGGMCVLPCCEQLGTNQTHMWVPRGLTPVWEVSYCSMGSRPAQAVSSQAWECDDAIWMEQWSLQCDLLAVDWGITVIGCHSSNHPCLPGECPLGHGVSLHIF